MAIHLLDARVPKGERVFAIGDIHGCLPQLEQLLSLIVADLEANQVKKHHIVFLGDYIDRGPNSRGAIKRLIKLSKSSGNVTCIKGNHEDKLLQFLANPREMARGFFTYGGVETALSYGLKSRMLKKPVPDALKIRDQLMEKIPRKHLKFLRKLKYSVSIGDYFFCHAGVRPGIKLKKQSAQDLMWIRQEFLSHPQLFSKVIVHGHTPHFEPQVMANRINIDTRCYDSGILTCLVLEKRHQRFIQAGGKNSALIDQRKIAGDQWL